MISCEIGRIRDLRLSLIIILAEPTIFALAFAGFSILDIFLKTYYKLIFAFSFPTETQDNKIRSGQFSNMKHAKILLLLFFIVLWTGARSQTMSDKRGFCGDLYDLGDLKAVDNLPWYYNWYYQTQANIQDEVKDYIDFTPMVWGSGTDRNALRAFLANHPEIKYLLGFNEPNFLEQANMTPTQAAELWPELEAIADEFDLKLVSPAANFSWVGGAVSENGTVYTDPVEYLDDFFAALPDSSRVDYIAVHGYFDNAGAIPWYIGLFEKYGKPIWLTEFNQSAETTTETSQQNYMVEAVNYLENDERVFRYAWFLTRSTQLNTNLFKNNVSGGLTDLGLIYTNMSSYDTAFYHAANDTIEAQHFVDMSGIHLLTVEDESGILAAHDFDDADWMDFNVEVENTEMFDLKIRLTSIWASSFSVYEGDSLLGSFQTSITNSLGEWETIQFQNAFELVAGKHRLRFVFHSGGWQFNWFQLSGVKTSVDEEIMTQSPSVNFYPNPVNKASLLNIDTQLERYSLSIYSVTGEKLLRLNDISGAQNINTSSLLPGIYLVLIHSQREDFTGKLIVK